MAQATVRRKGIHCVNIALIEVMNWISVPSLLSLSRMQNLQKFRSSLALNPFQGKFQFHAEDAEGGICSAQTFYVSLSSAFLHLV